MHERTAGVTGSNSGYVPGTKTFWDYAKQAIKEAAGKPTSSPLVSAKTISNINKTVEDLIGSIPEPESARSRPRSGPSGSGPSGSGPSGLSSGFTTLSNGNVGFADSSMQSAADMINQTAESNNAWAAAQAQKQMDFQREMSNTAHLREVKDLQAAGLNPVLSAGGSGASTPTGALAQPDTSNTRLIAELAFSAINGLANTATGYASASKMEAGEGLFGKLSQVYQQNPLVKQLVNTALSTVGGTTKYVAARAFYKSMFK